MILWRPVRRILSVCRLLHSERNYVRQSVEVKMQVA